MTLFDPCSCLHLVGTNFYSFVVGFWSKVALTCVCVNIFSDTDNELTTEVGGYQHVVVLKNIKVVDGDIIEALQQLPRGTTDGDCIHEVLGFMCWKFLLVNCYTHIHSLVKKIICF